MIGWRHRAQESDTDQRTERDGADFFRSRTAPGRGKGQRDDGSGRQRCPFLVGAQATHHAEHGLRFRDSDALRRVFEWVVGLCIAAGLVKANRAAGAASVGLYRNGAVGRPADFPADVGAQSARESRVIGP